jgi:crossover junction endodeoxyribonuclease RuvC
MKSRKSTPTQNNILAVDPGFDRIGVAILREEGQKQELLHSECIVTDKKDSHAERLLDLGLKLQAIIKEWKPAQLAVEKLFFNQNTSSALGVAEARGIIIYEARLVGMAVYEYSPQDVKIAVTSYGKADKAQVEYMTRKLLKMESEKKRLDDELDAIALGITHLAMRKGI